jgi:hypothetical protein
VVDALRALDPGLANDFQTTQSANPRVQVDAALARRILTQVIKDGKITGAEAEALMRLINSPGRFTADGLDVLKKGIKKSIDDDSLFPETHKLLGGPEMLDVIFSLDMGSVGRINFESPGTAILYSPIDYPSIQQLLRDGDIKAYRLEDSGLNIGVGGGSMYYRSDLNQLVFPSGVNPTQKVGLIVHEATHAIQDWRDVPHKRMFGEADAYIAQAVAMAAHGVKHPEERHPARVAFDVKAAHLVVRGEANRSNHTWVDAYKAVVKAYVTFTNDSNFDQVVNTVDRSGPPIERNHLLMVQQAIETATRIMPMIPG